VAQRHWFRSTLTTKAPRAVGAPGHAHTANNTVQPPPTHYQGTLHHRTRWLIGWLLSLVALTQLRLRVVFSQCVSCCYRCLVVQMLVHGNIEQDAVPGLVSVVAQSWSTASAGVTFGAVTLPNLVPAQPGFNVFQLHTPNPNDPNAAVLTSFQVGLRDFCSAPAFAATREVEAPLPVPINATCLRRSLAVDLIGAIIAVRGGASCAWHGVCVCVRARAFRWCVWPGCCIVVMMLVLLLLSN